MAQKVPRPPLSTTPYPDPLGLPISGRAPPSVWTPRRGPEGTRPEIYDRDDSPISPESEKMENIPPPAGGAHATGAPGALPVRPVGLRWQLQGAPGEHQSRGRGQSRFRGCERVRWALYTRKRVLSEPGPPTGYG
eukprot:scaffold32379_cov30-Phaeocystis_antarctica.AAC.2